MAEPIIVVRNLTHRYDGMVAVDGISFSVDRGEIFSFLGPNGAGKSTTINVLNTLLSLQEGEARVAGHDVAADPAAVRRSIGIVFQDEVLDRDLTVRETLEFHGRLYGIPAAERSERIREMLGIVGLTHKQEVRTKHLSGGMKRRLEIARGLMTRPEVLFLDEPTLGLDPQTRLSMWDYIRRVNREGTTIFLTTHYMDEADSLSDRISIIDGGRIIAEGPPDELKNALGEDVITLETGDPGATLTALDESPLISGVRMVDGRVTAHVRVDGSRCLPALLEHLQAREISVTAVNIQKPTMDDVFVHHTGRGLRDGGEQG
ncbi:MAG: ATP-binding cassette domain-containing protein [Methanomicrobiales archaeon]